MRWGNMGMTPILRHFPARKTMQIATVIGLGTMGHGIAQTFALAGIHVQIFDDQAAVRDSVCGKIRDNLNVMLNSGLLSGVDPDQVLKRISVFDNERAALHGSEMVTEAIVEDLETKRALLKRCEDVVDATTILASNTSSFPMTQIARDLKRPQRAINTHWFNPPHVIPVVEVIPGERTSDETRKTAMAVLSELGKQPIHIRHEIPGFVLNRIQVAMFREMLDLIERGVISAEDLDVAIKGSLGLRWAASGPMRVGDFGGWDVLGKVYDVLAPDLKSDCQIPPTISKMMDQGKYGIKTGQGFFEYPAEQIPEIVADKDRRFMAWARLLAQWS